MPKNLLQTGRRLFALSRDEIHIVLLILLIKVLLFGLGIITHDIHANLHPDGLLSDLDIWNQWDSRHYLDIAQQGYVMTGDEKYNLAFFPLYPFVVHCLIAMHVPPIIGAILVSGIASLFVGVLLYRLARIDYRAGAARRAVWFQFVFPTAYFLNIGMTESLFIALMLGTFLAARRGRWGVAGMLGFLATMTRVNGLLLLPSLVVEAFLEYRQTRRINPRWLWILGVAGGFGVYLLINYHTSDNWLEFMKIQHDHFSHDNVAWPWTSVKNSWSWWLHSTSGADAQMIGLQESVFAVIGWIFVIAACFKSRASYAVWCVSNWMLITCMSFLLSTPRYILILFPMFLLLGRYSVRRHVFLYLSVTCLIFYALFAAIFAEGRWAF